MSGMANEAQGVADEPEGHFSLRRDQMKAIARRSNYLFCKSKQPKPGPSPSLPPPHPSSLTLSLTCSLWNPAPYFVSLSGQE